MKFTMWDDDGGNDYELIGAVKVKVSAILEHIANGTKYVKDLKHIQKPKSNRGKIKIIFTQQNEPLESKASPSINANAKQNEPTKIKQNDPIPVNINEVMGRSYNVQFDEGEFMGELDELD